VSSNPRLASRQRRGRSSSSCHHRRASTAPASIKATGGRGSEDPWLECDAGSGADGGGGGVDGANGGRADSLNRGVKKSWTAAAAAAQAGRVLLQGEKVAGSVRQGQVISHGRNILRQAHFRVYVRTTIVYGTCFCGGDPYAVVVRWVDGFPLPCSGVLEGTDGGWRRCSTLINDRHSSGRHPSFSAWKRR